MKKTLVMKALHSKGEMIDYLLQIFVLLLKVLDQEKVLSQKEINFHLKKMNEFNQNNNQLQESLMKEIQKGEE